MRFLDLLVVTDTVNTPSRTICFFVNDYQSLLKKQVCDFPVGPYFMSNPW